MVALGAVVVLEVFVALGNVVAPGELVTERDVAALKYAVDLKMWNFLEVRWLTHI